MRRSAREKHGRGRGRSERRADGQVPRGAASCPRPRSSTAMRERTLDVEIMPVLCGSAFKNKGVQAMLDAVIELLPSPLDIPPVTGIDDDDKEDTPQGRRRASRSPALAFKIMTDPFVGSLTFFRVYSGALNSGDAVYNPIKGKQGARRPHPADARQQARRDQGSARRRHRRGRRPEGRHHRRHAVRIGQHHHPGEHEFPEPVISMAIEPKTKADQEKMGIALGRLAQEDPSFRVRTDEESGQTIIAGMGELHLEIIVDRMKREFNVEANVGKPQVAYRETIRKAVEGRRQVRAQSGGKGQFGHVVARDRAAGAGQGLRVRERDRRRRGAEGIHPGGRQGHPEAMANGLMAGYPSSTSR